MPHQGTQLWSTLRTFGTVMLAVAFFLPVSSCTPIGVEKSLATQEIEKKEQRRYRYAFQQLEINKPMSWPLLVAFFWPMAALAYRNKRPRHIGLGLTISELLLCLMSGWAIFTLTFLYRLEYGAYVAYGAVGIYFIVASVETARLVRERFH